VAQRGFAKWWAGGRVFGTRDSRNRDSGFGIRGSKWRSRLAASTYAKGVKRWDLTLVPVAIPENANVIIGQSHFIKTVEDL